MHGTRRTVLRRISTTSDYLIVTHHDPDPKRFYNDPRLVQVLMLTRLRQLKTQPGGESDELAQAIQTGENLGEYLPYAEGGHGTQSGVEPIAGGTADI